MLTPKENYLALVSNGTPDRFVNQYEAFGLIFTDPLRKMDKRIRGQDTIDPWGVTIRWPADEHAGTPYVTDETKVCDDITEWRETVKAPDLDLPDDMWQAAKADAEKIRNEGQQLVTAYCTTGMFERLHFLMGFEDALCNLLMEPESVEELLDYILEWRMKYMSIIIDKLHPEAVFFHDDWGSKEQLFMRPEVWRELVKPRYQTLYGELNRQGIHVIHHSDSFCEPIVGDMVDVGIETWQGVLPSNNIPEIQKTVAGKLTLMGGLDAGKIDRKGVTEEEVRAEVQRAIREYAPGGHYIPSITYGGPESIFPGVFETITDEINKQSKLYF